MGEVISLRRYRERRDPGSAALGRLDRAVRRLDPLVRERAAALTPTIERELLVIARAVADGSPARAAERAERLAGILEHPAASG